MRSTAGMLCSRPTLGVLLLRSVEKELGLASRLASCIREWRKPEAIVHPLEEERRAAGMFAIAAGYEDGDDCDSLRHDPIFKMAVGHAPESGDPLCSQPTMSRLENAPSKIEIARLMAAMVDQFCDSYPGGSRRVHASIASPPTRPSPLFRRVGIRVFTFEACSGFTHITARWIAQPPKAAFVTRLRPAQLPKRAARQLPDQSTTLWVESSSTGDTRPRGALNKRARVP